MKSDGSFMSHQIPTPLSRSACGSRPTTAGLGLEVRKRADPGHGIVVLLPRARLAEQVTRPPFRVDGVVLVHLHAGVHYGHDAEALFRQVRGELLGIWETFFIPGEDSVAVHVVDVEVDDVARDVPLPEVARHLAHLVLVHVAVAALLVTQDQGASECGPSARCSWTAPLPGSGRRRRSRRGCRPRLRSRRGPRPRAPGRTRRAPGCRRGGRGALPLVIEKENGIEV